MKIAPTYVPKDTTQLEDWMSDWGIPQSPTAQDIKLCRDRVNALVEESGGKKLSQEWWARALGIALKSYQRWESGKLNNRGRPHRMPAACWIFMQQVAERVEQTVSTTPFPSQR